MTYASNTTVPVEKTRAEIERVLTRSGATQFASGWDEKGAHVGFRMHDRFVRFYLPLPARDERRFTVERYGRKRTPEAALRLWEQACRARWRALLLSVKAKLESVASGIESFEQAFLATRVDAGRKDDRRDRAAEAERLVPRGHRGADAR